MTDWHQIAIDLAQSGMNSGEVTRAIQAKGLFGDEPFHRCYERVRKYIRKHTIRVNATQSLEPTEWGAFWDGSSHLKFGLIGDTHICGKYTQLSYLNDFYDICVNEGVQNVYHTGDITDGYNMRIGHENELYIFGIQNQIDHVAKVYPKRKGITTHFITGNHDASAYKCNGTDIGKAIDLQRQDMKYLGRDWARLNLTPNCVLELRHPWDGSSSAISSKPQKLVDNMDYTDKPTILAVGHYHKAEYLFYKGVHVFQTGCFQGTTPFERGKNLLSTMGGWIIDLEFDSKGEVHSITPKFIPFTPAVKQDYEKFV